MEERGRRKFLLCETDCFIAKSAPITFAEKKKRNNDTVGLDGESAGTSCQVAQRIDPCTLEFWPLFRSVAQASCSRTKQGLQRQGEDKGLSSHWVA